MSSDEKKLIRPVDLPIYDSVHKPQKMASEAKPEEPSMALEAVRTVRLALQDGWTQIVQAKGQADDIIATGQAHTERKSNFKYLMQFLKYFVKTTYYVFRVLSHTQRRGKPTHESGLHWWRRIFGPYDRNY